MKKYTPRQVIKYLLVNRKYWPQVLYLILATVIIVYPVILNKDKIAYLGSSESHFYFINQNPKLTIGNTFQISLHVKTGKKAINSIGSTINFNPNQLEVTKMTTEDSFCTFYADNSFDNIKGEVAMYCGTPNPGFTGDSTVVTLTFRAKTSGKASLIIDKKTAQILANDGKGTDLNTNTPSLNLQIDAM